MQETLVCPAYREEDKTTIRATKTPTPLLAHSPASPDMAAMVIYQKSYLHLPFYRQSKDWLQKGVPPVVLYDYQPGRSGGHPIRFLSGFTGMLLCCTGKRLMRAN